MKPVGAEPDASYYIEHAAQLDGLETIDLRTSPPPDLAVEVDISQQRMEKFSLYAKLRVPEFWRYDRAGLKAFELREHAYHEIAVSAVIPGLPLASLDVFLERRLQANRLPVLRDWKTWLLANRPAQE